MQQYDTVLKKLLMESARQSLRQLKAGGIVKWLPLELPKVQNLRWISLAKPLAAR